MKPLSKILALATFVLAVSLPAHRASAMCSRGEWLVPCVVFATCNNDSVCKYDNVTAIESYATCKNDCPCEHDTCTAGGALSTACQAKVWLVWAVCQNDDYCCRVKWDQQCVDEANTWGTGWAAVYGTPSDGCRGNYKP
jgi:hypothetical protein